MKDLKNLSVVKVLESSSRTGLGRGNLGVVMAKAGVGKTACLIHIAMHKLFQNEKLIHISLDNPPEKVTSYYRVIFSELVKALEIGNEQEIKASVEKNRMILSYLNQSFQIQRLKEYLKNLAEKVGHFPDTLIVDGLDFSKAERDVFVGLKEIAQTSKVEIWLSALAGKDPLNVNERGIPYPCSRFDDLLSIILLLEPTQSEISVKLLKHPDQSGAKDLQLKLDSNTFLAVN
jgi:hypothetical protein